MLKSWRLGSVMGFPVDISVSFLILLALVFVAFGGLAGVLVVGLAFASVVLHELGHAIVARKLGVRVSGIELGFLGGVAKMDAIPRIASHEIAIAAAGPAVSLMLGGAGLGLGALLHAPLFATIGWINLVLAGFNLIPALPMDGGRILRAALSRRMSYVQATAAAVKVSRVVAIGFAVIGLTQGAFQLLLLAPFLWMMGTRELLHAQLSGDHHAFAGGVEVLGRDAWSRRGGSPERRYRLRQVGGRMVIESID